MTLEECRAALKAAEIAVVQGRVMVPKRSSSDPLQIWITSTVDDFAAVVKNLGVTIVFGEDETLGEEMFSIELTPDILEDDDFSIPESVFDLRRDEPKA